MFKKSLIALALTGFATVATAASTIPQTIVDFSSEGVVNDVTIASSLFNDVTVVAGIANGYSTGDQVVFTFPNDTFDISTAAAIADAQDDGAVGTAPDLAFGAPVYSNGNTVSFTIGTVTQPLLLADKLVLSGIVLEGANLAGGGTVAASFHVVSSVNGSQYEASSETVAQTIEQLSVSLASAADAFVGVVDVNETRKLFVAANNTTTTTDEMTITAVDASGSTVQDATLNSIAYTLVGDFSFTDTDGDGTPNYGVDVSVAGDEAIAADMQSVTWTHTSAAAHVVTITASNAGTPTAIPVQNYTVNTVMSYDPITLNAGGVDSTESASTAVGGWTLNGSSFTVPYMPYGANTKPILSLTNTGSLAGEVLVSYMTETGTAWVEFDTAGLMSDTGITDLAGTINGIVAEIVAADPTATSGKLSLQVTVNAPDTAITGYAAFKVVNADGESRVSIGAYGEHGNRSRGSITTSVGTYSVK